MLFRSLRELVPQASAIGALFDPSFLAYEDQFRDVREAARALDLQVYELRASTDAEIDLAYETVARQRKQPKKGGTKPMPIA